MVMVRKPIIENPVYSQLLFSINIREDVYASQLATELGKTQSTTQTQLMFLADPKRAYLHMKDHPDKQKNIKLFSVNWERINVEFLDYLIKEKTRIDGRVRLLGGAVKLKPTKVFDNLKRLDNQDFRDNIQTNKYLRLLFQNSFTYLATYIQLGVTLEDLFKEIAINPESATLGSVVFLSHKDILELHLANEEILLGFYPHDLMFKRIDHVVDKYSTIAVALPEVKQRFAKLDEEGKLSSKMKQFYEDMQKGIESRKKRDAERKLLNKVFHDLEMDVIKTLTRDKELFNLVMLLEIASICLRDPLLEEAEKKGIGIIQEIMRDIIKQEVNPKGRINDLDKKIGFKK